MSYFPSPSQVNIDCKVVEVFVIVFARSEPGRLPFSPVLTGDRVTWLPGYISTLKTTTSITRQYCYFITSDEPWAFMTYTWNYLII